MIDFEMQNEKYYGIINWKRTLEEAFKPINVYYETFENQDKIIAKLDTKKTHHIVIIGTYYLDREYGYIFDRRKQKR